MCIRCWLNDPQFSTRFGRQAYKFGGRQAIGRLHILEMKPHTVSHGWNLFGRPTTKETSTFDQLDQNHDFGREPHINGVKFHRETTNLQFQRTRINLVKTNIVEPVDVDLLGLHLLDHLVHGTSSLCRIPVLLRDQKW